MYLRHGLHCLPEELPNSHPHYAALSLQLQPGERERQSLLTTGPAADQGTQLCPWVPEVEENRSVEEERGLHDGGPGDTTGQQGVGQDQVGGEGGTGLPAH